MCGIKGVWQEAGKDFFYSQLVVTEVPRVSDGTLYSWWHADEGRWMTAEELAAEDVEPSLAAQIAFHLSSSLLHSV